MTTLLGKSGRGKPYDPVQAAVYLLTGVLLGLLVLAWGMAYRGTLAGGWSRALLTQTGQFGYLLLAASCVLGSLIGTRLLPRVFSSALKTGWHGVLSGFALTLLGIHGLFSLVGPGALRLPGALVPGLARYDTLALALGTLSLYLAAAVYVTWALYRLRGRGRLGYRAARALHLLAYPAFVLGTLHAVWLGQAGLTEVLGSAAVGAALALRAVLQVTGHPPAQSLPVQKP
ncbi:ferric reductase [Deinococcus sp. UYEF24]